MSSTFLAATLARSQDGSPERAFEWHVRSLHARGRHARAPCILDASAANCAHFAIGSFDLVSQDLQAALPPALAASFVASLTTSGVARAYELRRELVHFKKACLNMLRDVMQLERGLVRQSTFFYVESERCGELTCPGECARCQVWRSARRSQLNFCRRHRRDEAAAADCEDDYLECSELLQSVKGFRLALADVRNLAKQVCLLPRHPDDAEDKTPPALRDMGAAMMRSP